MMPKTSDQDESDILAKPALPAAPASNSGSSNVERTSSQMRPTR